jgi:phosphatidate cytidylyltransferase
MPSCRALRRMSRFSGLAARVVTAIIGGSALIALIVHGGRWGGFLLAGLLTIAMLYELGDMAFRLPDAGIKKAMLIAAALAVLACRAWEPGSVNVAFAAAVMAIFAFHLLAAHRHRGAPFLAHYQDLASSILGLGFVGWLLLFIPGTLELRQGKHWLLLLLVEKWAGDTAAYFAGKSLGRRKLYAFVSPNKTWEGAVAGLIGGVAAAAVYRACLIPQLDWGLTLLAGAALSVAGQVGDLCESLVKRAFDRKDSGAILPGHGGLLDRFDGVLFGLPVAYVLGRLAEAAGP